MTDSTTRPAPAPRPSLRLALHLAAFVLLLGLWTWKLVSPYPVPESVRKDLTPGLAFVLAKALHAGAYAFLAVFGGLLPVPGYWRRFLVGLLVLHGAATEVAQYAMNVGRTGQVTDVLIDWAGVALGLLGCQIWLRHRS